MSADLAIERDVPLAPRTTLGLGGRAEYLVVANDDVTALAAFAWAKARGLSATVLGGGSNVVVNDAGVPGLVVVMASRGIEWRDHGDVTRVTAKAGEPWDAFVALAIARGLAGVECLAGIPGLVGAVPIQNVGAYGQEVSGVIVEVQVLERVTGEVRTLGANEYAFGYRDSAFKHEPGRWLVLAVTFELREGARRRSRTRNSPAPSSSAATRAHPRSPRSARRCSCSDARSRWSSTPPTRTGVVSVRSS